MFEIRFGNLNFVILDRYSFCRASALNLDRYVLEKYMFVSRTKNMQRKNSGSTSFTIDNMCYINFRIQEQESVPWCCHAPNPKRSMA